MICDWERILENIYIYIYWKGNSDCHFKCLSYENEGFAFISDRYMIKFTETAYETSIKTWIRKSKLE